MDNVVHMGTVTNSYMACADCAVDNVVHMGTVTNSYKIWHVLTVQWTTWYTWVQSPIATRYGMC